MEYQEPLQNLSVTWFDWQHYYNEDLLRVRAKINILALLS